MIWARMLAYVTGMVNQELLLRNEHLAAENRILRSQIKGRLLLSEGEKATLAEIAHRRTRIRSENLSLANCYFAHNSSGFSVRYDSASGNLLVLSSCGSPKLQPRRERCLVE